MEFEILTITYSKVISNTRILHIDTKPPKTEVSRIVQ